MKRTRKLILALVVVMSLLMAMAVAVIPASAASGVTFNGTFNDWQGTDTTLVDGWYTAQITLTAGWHEFKVVDNGTWKGNGGTIADSTEFTSSTGWQFSEGAGNCQLYAGSDGEYTFMYKNGYVKVLCPKTTITLKPSSNWKKDGARFAVYFYMEDGNKKAEAWVSLNDANADGYYDGLVPVGYTYIFTRMNGSTTDNNWNNKWNEAKVATNPSTYCYYSISTSNWDNSGTVITDHAYVDNCDAVCDVCGETRTAPHSYDETKYVAIPETNNHGYKCQDCDTYKGATAHTPNEDDGDCTTAINCSACSAVTTEGKASHTSSEDDGDLTTAVKCANEGCEHIFVEAKEAITLTIPTFENGTVTAGKKNYAIGEIVTLTITPNGGYFQKLTIDGEPLLLGWKATTYSFVAEKDTYVIGGSFEPTLEMYAGDWGRWDNTNHAHGILSAYYPSNNDAWWIKIAGNYDSLSINAKNYREIANSYEGSSDGPWRIALYMQLDNGNYYAFSMWINTDKVYAYNHFGGNIDGVASTTGWGGAWCLLSEKNAEATAALNGDGAEFKLERIDGNHIQITFGGTVLETYEIPGVTAANKVKSVGLLHYGNKGAHVDIPFELTVPCDHNTADCPHVLVGDEYKTVEDAFKSETTADITLNKDFVVPEGGLTTGGAILLGDGVTLDLNGQNLTAAGVVNFGGAKIVGEGLIVVDENKLIGKSADYLALWTTDGEVSGYALKKVNDLYNGGAVDGEENKYFVYFRPAFLDGSHFGTFSVAGHGVAFSVKITSENMEDIIVPVGEDVIQKVYDEMRVMKLNLKNAAPDKTYNIYLVMTSGQAEYVDSLGTITNGEYAK